MVCRCFTSQGNALDGPRSTGRRADCQIRPITRDNGNPGVRNRKFQMAGEQVEKTRLCDTGAPPAAEKRISTQEKAKQAGAERGVTYGDNCEIAFGCKICGTHDTYSGKPRRMMGVN